MERLFAQPKRATLLYFSGVST